MPDGTVPSAAPVRKLLLAEDEPSLRLLVRMTLLNESYEILEAEDGFEALALARAEKPRMILLDVRMPGLSGFDVCAELKADPATSDIVIVMLSAQGRADDLERGARVGADAYFTKPFSPVALLRKVDEVFRRVGT